jgi:hypothetical protein
MAAWHRSRFIGNFTVRITLSGFQVVSLYNSASHRAYYCDDDVCIKRTVGSAGSVFCRSVVSGLLDSLTLDSTGVIKVGGGDGFDWGFSRYFEQHHLPIFVLNRSMAAHFGQIGSWGSTSVRMPTHGSHTRARHSVYASTHRPHSAPDQVN